MQTKLKWKPGADGDPSLRAVIDVDSGWPSADDGRGFGEPLNLLSLCVYPELEGEDDTPTGRYTWQVLDGPDYNGPFGSKDTADEAMAYAEHVAETLLKRALEQLGWKAP